jgi:hypothetical protein
MAARIERGHKILGESMKKYFCIPAIAAMLFLTLFAFTACTGSFIDPSYSDFMNKDGGENSGGGGAAGTLTITVTNITGKEGVSTNIWAAAVIDDHVAPLTTYSDSDPVNVLNGVATLTVSVKILSKMYPTDPVYVFIEFGAEHRSSYFIGKTAYRFNSGKITESFSDFLSEDDWEAYTGYKD